MIDAERIVIKEGWVPAEKNQCHLQHSFVEAAAHGWTAIIQF